MTSPRQLQANRANARKSTGPRSAIGKQVAARNAVRHGLSARRHDATREENIAQLAKLICPDSAPWLQKEMARTIAEAQGAVSEVRRARALLIERTGMIGQGKNLGVVGSGIMLLALQLVERYEGRALSRRRRAIRNLDDIQLDQP